MSWTIALLAAFLNGLITAAVTAPVADRVTKAHGVSDFEGGRGMAIAFLFIPAGFIAGAIVALVSTRLVHASAWADFGKALGLSIVLSQSILFSIAGLSLLSIPRPPLLDGHRLQLEVEVHIPVTRLTPRSQKPDQIRLSLFGGKKDNSYARIDRSKFRELDGKLIVPATMSLNTKAAFRMFSFHIEEHTWLALDPVPLPPTPTAANFDWSELLPLREARTTNSQYVYTDVKLRLRVVKGEVFKPK